MPRLVCCIAEAVAPLDLVQKKEMNGTQPPPSEIPAVGLLTYRQAASYLGIGESTLYRLVKTEGIPVVRLGGCSRIRREDLDSLINKKMTTGRHSN